MSITTLDGSGLQNEGGPIMLFGEAEGSEYMGEGLGRGVMVAMDGW